MLTRKQDWQLHFEKCVSDNYNKKFEWGTHDCWLWSANLVLAITGEDIAKEYRGKYNSARTALEIIKTYGGISELCTKYVGKEPVSPLFASVGDLVLIEYLRQEAMAICDGRTVLTTGSDGLLSLPISTTIKAWRI